MSWAYSGSQAPGEFGRSNWLCLAVWDNSFQLAAVADYLAVGKLQEQVEQTVEHKLWIPGHCPWQPLSGRLGVWLEDFHGAISKLQTWDRKPYNQAASQESGSAILDILSQLPSNSYCWKNWGFCHFWLTTHAQFTEFRPAQSDIGALWVTLVAWLLARCYRCHSQVHCKHKPLSSSK